MAPKAKAKANVVKKAPKVFVPKVFVPKPAVPKKKSTKRVEPELSVDSMTISEPSKVAKTKRADITDHIRLRNATKPHLNVIVIGHVDAGKSTLVGHLLHKLGDISSHSVSKLKKEASQNRKATFEYAYVMDTTEEERIRGVTIDISLRTFVTENRTISIIDSPGHVDFVPQMIGGSEMADYAVLVIDASVGGFEKGMRGQTLEHLMLVKGVGVTQIIVVINQLDRIKWDEKRIQDIKGQLGAVINDLNLQASWIEASGLTGDNLVDRREGSSGTLIECLDSLKIPTRDVEGNFVLAVQDYFKGGYSTGLGGDVSVCGRIAYGTVQVGDRIKALPINLEGTVKAIQVGDDDSNWAMAGDRVTLSLSGLDILQISLGTVICQTDTSTVKMTSRFEALIQTFDIEIPLTIGVKVVFHHLGSQEEGIVSELIEIIGGKKRPRAVGKNCQATVVVTVARPICGYNSGILGRFLLRRGQATVASGNISSILD